MPPGPRPPPRPPPRPGRCAASAVPAAHRNRRRADRAAPRRAGSDRPTPGACVCRTCRRGRPARAWPIRRPCPRARTLPVGECRSVRRPVRRPARNRTIPVFPPPRSRTSGMRAEQTWPGVFTRCLVGGCGCGWSSRRAGDLAGAAGVDGERPAELVQQHVVVPPAPILEVSEAGGAAVGPVDHVVGFASCGGLVAAARLPAATRPAHRRSCAVVCGDQRQPGRPGRQHRAEPPPLPGQAAPPPGHHTPAGRLPGAIDEQPNGRLPALRGMQHPR